jgi:hypothetical protein
MTITVTQPATANYPSGTATKMLTITSAPPPTITVTFNAVSPVTYEPGKSIEILIASNNPVAASSYTVGTNNTVLTSIVPIYGTNGISKYMVNLNQNQIVATDTTVVITVTQPASGAFSGGTGTGNLVIKTSIGSSPGSGGISMQVSPTQGYSGQYNAWIVSSSFVLIAQYGSSEGTDSTVSGTGLSIQPIYNNVPFPMTISPNTPSTYTINVTEISTINRFQVLVREIGGATISVISPVPLV